MFFSPHPERFSAGRQEVLEEYLVPTSQHSRRPNPPGGSSRSRGRVSPVQTSLPAPHPGAGQSSWQRSRLGEPRPGSTETKQSQEHGVSGLPDAIWERWGCVCPSQATSDRERSREHPSQHINNTREDTATGLRRTAPLLLCSVLGVLRRRETSPSLHGLRFGIADGLADRTLRGPALLGNVTLQGSRRAFPHYPTSLQESQSPSSIGPFSLPQHFMLLTLSPCKSPKADAQSYSLRFR